MRYAVVIEKANGNYSAYVPDLPGCVATGATIRAVEEQIRAAIRFHIAGLKEDGLPVPSLPAPLSMWRRKAPRRFLQPSWPSTHDPCARKCPGQDHGRAGGGR